MGLWIELHCDVRNMEEHEPTGELRCWTHVNANEGVLVGNTGGDARWALRDLAARAKALGWKRTREGWQCPACVRVLAERKAQQ